MNNPICLLIARRSEFNLHRIETVLQHRRVPYEVISPAFDERETEFTLRIGGDSNTATLFNGKGKEFCLEHVRSVWTRGPHYIGDAVPTINTVQSRAIAESAYALRHLWERLSDRKWVNPLAGIDRTNRVTQSCDAIELGFEVPLSIVSTSGKAIRDFVDEHGDCIIKPISQGARSERGPGLVMAERFQISDELPSIMDVPALVQKFVEKHHELRVAVVGDRVFAAAIDSASDERTRVDSRFWAETGLSYYRVVLTDEEVSKIVALNRRFGYAYSSMDFIRSSDGTLTFLEANPSGQWAFLEFHTGYPITESIVDLLTA